MKYQVAHTSLRGARTTNEDRIGFAERDNAVLLVVADGLGGHNGGEIAAEILKETLVHSFQSVRQPRIERPVAFLALGMLKAHHAIVAYTKESPTPVEPRTTCVACLVQDGYAYWAHAGDSRLYHFRGKKLLQRTRDHSTVEELHRGGILSEAEMQEHPQRGHLRNCLGGGDKPSISVGEETALQRGDTLLLCSDGVWEAFSPDELIEQLQPEFLDDAVAKMLRAAEKKMQRSCDNLSAICLRWEDAVSKLPLAPHHSARDVNEQLLHKEARQRTKSSKPAPRKILPAVDHSETDRGKSLEDRIKEVEDFLSQFDSKIK